MQAYRDVITDFYRTETHKRRPKRRSTARRHVHKRVRAHQKHIVHSYALRLRT